MSPPPPTDYASLLAAVTRGDAYSDIPHPVVWPRHVDRFEPGLTFVAKHAAPLDLTRDQVVDLLKAAVVYEIGFLLEPYPELAAEYTMMYLKDVRSALKRFATSWPQDVLDAAELAAVRAVVEAHRWFHAGN